MSSSFFLEGYNDETATTNPLQTYHRTRSPRQTLGRDNNNDLILENEIVSGFHASIFNDSGKIIIVDLGSSNGTRVTGKRIDNRSALNP
jgi:pSer/pThr/pTyr-binding forkhead associated (FHA) protein